MMLLLLVKSMTSMMAKGVTEAIRTKNNMDGMDKLIEVVKKTLMD